LKALLAGLGAGALWGLAFVAPDLVRPATPVQLTALRYLVFGLSSAVVLVALPCGGWRWITKRYWRRLLCLALTGNTLYYLLLSEAVQRSGSILPAMIIGILPVVIAIVGGIRQPAFHLGRFIVPGCLILVGLFLHMHEAAGDVGFASGTIPWIGIVCAVAALLSWTVYGILNAETLAADPSINAAAWTALTGVATLTTLAPLTLLVRGVDAGPWHGEPTLYALLFWALCLGLLSSWAATWLWNIASGRMRSELLGYLIVSETVFGVIFALMVDQRTPSLMEVLGLAALMVGVLLGIRAATKVNTDIEPKAPV
jgi:drug/metabolite transporter (DMT)-like permease